jgi:hypothetical protein
LNCRTSSFLFGWEQRIFGSVVGSRAVKSEFVHKKVMISKETLTMRFPN